MKSYENYDHILNSINDGVYSLNADGYFTYVNKVMIEKSGYKEQTFYSLHFTKIIHPEYHDQAVKNFQWVMKTKNEICSEFRYITAGGEVRVLEVRSIPICEGGKAIGLVGVARNITKRKKAEEELRRSEEKYKALMENASDAIMLGDEEGNFIEVNRKAEELFGYTRDELLNMNYTKFCPDDELKRAVNAFNLMIKGKLNYLRDSSVIRKDGTIIPIDISATVVEYSGVRVILGSFRDMSEHKFATEILEKKVTERTAELSKMNALLIKEIKERKILESELRRKAKESSFRIKKFEECNIALKVLLSQREQDRAEVEENILTNIKYLINPDFEALKKRRLDVKSKILIENVETNLKDITSSFSHNLFSKYANFTPTEIKVANLIRQGNTTKEIAGMLSVSDHAIELHRFNMRKKLGLKSRKVNLESYLLSIG